MLKKDTHHIVFHGFSETDFLFHGPKKSSSLVVSFHKSDHCSKQGKGKKTGFQNHPWAMLDTSILNVLAHPLQVFSREAVLASLQQTPDGGRVELALRQPATAGGGRTTDGDSPICKHLVSVTHHTG